MIIIYIFSKRPLFTSCSLFLLASVCAFFAPETVKLIIIAISATALIITIALFIFKKLNTYSTLYFSLCAAMVAIAMLVSYSYFDVLRGSYEKYDGQECVIDAVVISTGYMGEGYSTHNISVNSINGEPNYHKSTLTCKYMSAMEPGERFTAKVIAKSIFEEDDGLYNESNNMAANGIFIAYMSSDENAITITDDDVFDIRIFSARINSKLSGILTRSIKGEAGNFASALFLGNDHLLSGETQRDFNRSGVSHILALSGMHVSILIGAIMLLLKKLRIKHGIIAVIITACSVSYLAITGFSVSASRAVIMFLIVYLSTLIEGISDSLTALGISGVILVLVSPGTVIDVGFWMSVSATLGILAYLPVFKQYINNVFLNIPKYKLFFKILAKVINAIATGLFAFIPLFVVLCFSIQQFQLFSIVSSAILALPSEFILILSLLILPISKISVLSSAISTSISYLFEFMIDYCSYVSEMHGVVISLNYTFTTIFAVIIFACVIWSLAVKSRNVFRSLIPFALSIAAFITVASVYEKQMSQYVNVEYVNSSSDADMLVISNSREAIICDIGNGSNKSYRDALNVLYAVRATEVRAIMLTRYEYAHNASLYNMFTSNIVRELWLPEPIDGDEYHHMVSIYNLAERYGVDVYLYSDGDTMDLFSYTNLQAFRGKIDRSAVPISIISVSTRGERATYLSPAYNECEELSEMAEDYAQRSNFLIFGNKGPRIKKSFTLPESRRIEAAAFADKEIAAYYGSYNYTFISTFLAEESFTINLTK